MSKEENIQLDVELLAKDREIGVLNSKLKDLQLALTTAQGENEMLKQSITRMASQHFKIEGYEKK